MKKTIFTSFLAFALALLVSMNVFAYGWQGYGTSWWYGTNADNSAWYHNGWQMIDGLWYYFDGSGWMAHDRWIGDYYVGPSGAMLTNTQTPDGYWVGTDGKWINNQTQGWTGEYAVSNNLTSGYSGYGVRVLNANSNSVHIEGAFDQVYGDSYIKLGYFDKTFVFADDCIFLGIAEIPIPYSRSEFVNILNNHNGLDFHFVVVNDVIVRAELWS